jgi:hypothetical protein
MPYVVVTQHTPMLELISGERTLVPPGCIHSCLLDTVSSGALVRWTPRLPRLETLELWDGRPLEDELLHASIFEHCPQFNSLMIYTWITEESDHKFSKFLGKCYSISCMGDI